jgi:Uma2 family endonuclease
MATQPSTGEHGPFRADQLHDGDRYELSNGHPIYCPPAGREHAGRNLTGAAVLETDPDVEWAGVDAGFTPDPGTLRAPDVAVAPAGTERGWIPGAPPLALEYAGPGQDDEDLRTKITELLQSGTRQVWVVHLTGPRRVEVHQPEQTVRVLGPGELLSAPGILRNPVPVEALYDREAGHRAVLRNLLQREGYEGIEAIREEGREAGRSEGIAQSILTLLAGRGLAIDDAARQRILACQDRAQLNAWLLAAARVEAAPQVFD